MHGEDYICLGFLFGDKCRVAYISDVSRFPPKTEYGECIYRYTHAHALSDTYMRIYVLVYVYMNVSMPVSMCECACTCIVIPFVPISDLIYLGKAHTYLNFI